MKDKFSIAVLCLVACVRSRALYGAPPKALKPSLDKASPSVRAEAPRAAPAMVTFPAWAEYLHDHVEIGTRMTYFDLTDNHRPADPNQEQTFIGYINVLDEDQNYAPTKFFADVWFWEHVGFELTWDEVEASTRNWHSGTSDGSVSMQGPILSVLYRYPVTPELVPYVGLGLAWWDAEFHTAGWWGGGWGSPAEFEAAGGHGNDPGDVRRFMNVNGETALVYSAGLIYQLADDLAADFLVRYMEISSDADFVRTVHGDVTLVRDGEFTLNNVAYGIGLRYGF